MYTEKELARFCRNIMNLRKIHGLSKAKMAVILGISCKTLEILESGTIPKRLSCEVIVNAANYFNISPHQLFINEIHTE